MEILWFCRNQLLLTVFWLIIPYAALIYCSGQLRHALLLAAVWFPYQAVTPLVVACVECIKQGSVCWLLSALVLSFNLIDCCCSQVGIWWNVVLCFCVAAWLIVACFHEKTFLLIIAALFLSVLSSLLMLRQSHQQSLFPQRVTLPPLLLFS